MTTLTGHTIGEQIRKARKQRNLRQEDLAAKVSVDRETVSRWENNHQLPDPDRLPALRKALKLPNDALQIDEALTTEEGIRQIGSAVSELLAVQRDLQERLGRLEADVHALVKRQPQRPSPR